MVVVFLFVCIRSTRVRACVFVQKHPSSTSLLAYAEEEEEGGKSRKRETNGERKKEGRKHRFQGLDGSQLARDVGSGQYVISGCLEQKRKKGGEKVGWQHRTHTNKWKTFSLLPPLFSFCSFHHPPSLLLPAVHTSLTLLSPSLGLLNSDIRTTTPQ